MINIVELDGLFAQYGYTLQEQREACRVYLLRQGMYYGAEIVIFAGKKKLTNRHEKNQDIHQQCAE